MIALTTTLAISFGLAAILNSQLMYAFPLIIAVSLVYGATRHEHLVPILKNAFRAGIWIVIFMSVIFAILWFVGWMI